MVDAPGSTQPSPIRRRISFDDAIHRIGSAIFGPDWIGKITVREGWLIDRYVDGKASSGIQPAHITYVDASTGRRWKELPRDPALVAEIERARDRRDWREAQYERVSQWLERRGFDIERDSFDAEKFERAFASFPNPIPKTDLGQGTVSQKEKPRALAASPRRRMTEALRELAQEGTDIYNEYRERLHKLTLERAGIPRGARGSDKRTFERALSDALQTADNFRQ